MAVAVGLVVLGLTAYGFLVIAARALGPEAYAPLSALWAMVFLVGPGCFVPIEQELARSLAARRAAGLGGGPVIRRAAALGGTALVVVAAGCAGVGIVLLDRLFDGQSLLVVGLLLSLAGYYAEHLARGALAGNGRFGPYGVALAAEGSLRLVGCTVLAGLGVATAGPYGIVLGAAPLIAAAIALRGQHDLATPGPDADRRELTVALGWLLAGSILAQALANAGPIAVKLLATDAERAVAGRFLAALIVARVPMFLFQAVLAPSLPRLARMAAAGDRHGFDAGLRRLLALVGAIGVVGTLGALVAGPTVVRTLFGSDFELPAHDLALLAVGCAAYLMALTLGQALIAVSGHGRVALAWLAGVAVFGIVTALGTDLLTRVELGMLAGSVVAAVTMAGLLLPLLVHRVGPTADATDLLASPPPGSGPVTQEGATTRITVVIPAFGDDPWLERAVASILASTGVDATAVVVDNGAVPATIERLADRTGVTIVRPGTNLGFAGGCNTGAAVGQPGDRETDGPDADGLVAFLNQDAILAPGALAALAEVALRPDVGIASASIRLADAPDTLNSAGNPVHFLGFSWSGAYGEPAAAHDAESDITGASGTAMAMRRDVWVALGGFVEEYFAYLEDAELSLRCWQRGLRVVYVPTAVVSHRYQFSRNPAKFYLLERNRLVLLLTVFERRTQLLLLPAALGAELGMLLVAARAGWLGPKLRGWGWVVRHRRWIRQHHRRLQAARVVSDRSLAPRLATRFDAANMGIPRWTGPLDAGLAVYWKLTRRMLRRERPLT